MSTLRADFLSGLTPAHREEASAMVDLEIRLEDLVRTGSMPHPDLPLPAARFVAHTAGLVPADSTVDAYLSALIAEDLYLACACAQGSNAAVTALETRYRRQLDGALSVIKHDLLETDDLRQIVRNKLFVSTPSAAAAIARYNGLGTLGGWIRVIAMRTGLNAVRRKDPRVAASPTIDALVPALADPELDYLKSTYRESFKEAFVLAVAELSSRERTLLRQSAVHRLSVREIGRMYGVHYATASRWIAEARKRLADRTRSELAQRLGLSEEQLDSIMRLIQSRIDVSLAAVLSSQQSNEK